MERIELNNPIVLKYLNDEDWLRNNNITIGSSPDDVTKAYSFKTNEFSEATKGGNTYFKDGKLLDPYTLVGMIQKEEDNKRWNEENSKSIQNKLHMSSDPDLFGNTRVNLAQRDHNSPYYKAMMEGQNMAGNLAISVATLPWTVSGLGGIGSLIKAGEWGSLIGGTAGAVGLTKATDAAVGAITNDQYTSLYDYLTTNGFSGYNAGLGYVPILSGAMGTAGKILETDLAGNLSKVNRFAENIASKTTPETVAALERPRTVFAAPAPKIKVQDNVITFKGNRMSPENMREGTIVQIGNDPLNAPKAIITHRVDRNPHFNFLKTENVGEAEIPQLAEAVNNNFPTKNLVATSYKDIDKKLANQAFGNTEDYAVTFDNRGNPIYRKRSEWEKRINARNSTPWETTDHYGLDLGNAKTLANDVKLFSKYRTKSEAVNLIKMKYPNLTDQEALNLYTLIMNAPPESVASHLGLHPIVVENARLNTAQLLHNNSSPLDINNLAAYGLPEPRIIGGQLAPVNLDSRGQLKGTYASFANITPTGQYAINYVDAYPVTPYVTKNGEFMMPVGNNANTGIFVHPAERRITPTLNPQFYQNLATGEIQASKIDNNIFLPWFKQLLSISRNPNFKGYTILNDSRPRKIDLANLKWNSPIQGDAYDENIGYIINQIPTNGLSADSNGLFPRLAKRMYGDEAGQHLYQSPAIVDYNMSTYDNIKVSDAIRQASTSDEMKKAINEILNPYLKEIGLSPSIYNGFMNEKPIGTVPFIVLKNGGKINKKNKFK